MDSEKVKEMKDEKSTEEKVFPFVLQYTVRVNAKDGEEALQALAKIRSKLEKDGNIQDIRVVKELKTEAQIFQHFVNIDI